MTDTVQMPELPGKAPNGTLRAWLKREGDSVAAGDALARIETENGVVLLESNRSGRLGRILVPAGKTVQPGTALAEIAEKEREGYSSNAGGTPAELAGKMPAVRAGGSVQPILMPQAGNEMEEGTILRWAAKEGDQVKAGDILFEIETDKAALEVESEYEGTLRRIVAREGEVVPVHAVVAYLADSDGELDAWLAEQGGGEGRGGAGEGKGGGTPPLPSAEAAARRSETAVSVSAPGGSTASGAGVSAPAPEETGRLRVSPAARRLAAKRRFDLTTVGVGSGPGGRILSGDLENISAAGGRPAGASAVTRAGAGVVAGPGAVAGPLVKDPPGTARKAMTPMRRAIARNMTNSAQTIPHFYMKLTVDAERLMKVYKRQKKVCRASLNDLLMAALARVMMDSPAFRSQVHGEELLEFESVNIGLAVSVEGGLRVPVITGVEKRSLAELAAETRRLIGEARDGKTGNAGKGTLTISNLGMTDTEEFTAIVNPPEAAILAVGRVREGVQVEKGELRPALLMTMWLSSNHRVVDGVMAARFLSALKKILEEPEILEGE